MPLKTLFLRSLSMIIYLNVFGPILCHAGSIFNGTHKLSCGDDGTKTKCTNCDCEKDFLDFSMTM